MWQTARIILFWIVLCWFALSLIGNVYGWVDYKIDPTSYRFPLEGFGWSYESADNYQLARTIGIAFSGIGIAFLWVGLRTKKPGWLLVCAAAIMLSYFKPY